MMRKSGNRFFASCDFRRFATSPVSIKPQPALVAGAAVECGAFVEEGAPQVRVGLHGAPVERIDHAAAPAGADAALRLAHVDRADADREAARPGRVDDVLADLLDQLLLDLQARGEMRD